MVFHWSLSDSKSPQVSRTLLSILADLSNAVVWMVSFLSLVSLPQFFFKLLESVPSAPVTTSITVTYVFHIFFCFLLLFFFTLCLYFRLLLSTVTVKSTRWQILFFLLINIQSGLLIHLYLKIPENFMRLILFD